MTEAHHGSGKGVGLALAQLVHLGSHHADSAGVRSSSDVLFHVVPALSTCHTKSAWRVVLSGCGTPSPALLASLPRKRESPSGRGGRPVRRSGCHSPGLGIIPANLFPRSLYPRKRRAGIHALVVRGNIEPMRGTLLHVIPALPTCHSRESGNPRPRRPLSSATDRATGGSTLLSGLPSTPFSNS